MINHIGILVYALSRRLAPRRTQEAWITEAEPLARQYRAVAVLSVAAFSAASSGIDIGAVAKGLLERSRFALTGASKLIHLPGAPLRAVPGYALARIPEFASWFAKTWSELRFEREQAWRRVATGADQVDRGRTGSARKDPPQGRRRRRHWSRSWSRRNRSICTRNASAGTKGPNAKRSNETSPSFVVSNQAAVRSLSHGRRGSCQQNWPS
jgi:hypothetical protein